jgi:phage-related protein
MKPLRFLGDSLECIRRFPEPVRHDAGYQLERVQHGMAARDFKPIPSVGKGVEELRVWGDSGTYRVLYITRFTEAVYVLHAFQKKTRATSERDIELARTRYAELRGGRYD